MKALMLLALLLGVAITAHGKSSVLFLVTNNGFYFQEYFDPFYVLSNNGVDIKVTSGLGGGCVPHAGSYVNHKNASNDLPSAAIPADGTARNLQNTLLLSSVTHSGYDALVVVGGWGASRYYYGYPGVYDDATFAPVAAQATEANRLINEFITNDKWVLGVCNGVNVLSWARMNSSASSSPVRGKTVSAPWQAAPPQRYPNPYPSGSLQSYGSDWALDVPCALNPAPGSNCFPFDQFPRDNGAVVDDFGTRQNPQAAVRDMAVSVSGRIITAQDNLAAKYGAEVLLQRLAASSGVTTTATPTTTNSGTNAPSTTSIPTTRVPIVLSGASTTSSSAHQARTVSVVFMITAVMGLLLPLGLL